MKTGFLGGRVGDRKGFRSILIAGIALALVSCGAGDSRQDALDALERTTAASDLEAQMAGLVESTGLAITPAQGKKLGNEIERIDGEAETILTSSSSDANFDQSIDTAVTETREAGNQLAVAVEKPAQLVTARKKASARLVKSNRNLKTATTEIGTELADDDGNLSEQDAAALEKTVASVQESGQAVDEAVESAACSVPGEQGGAFWLDITKGDLSCTEAAKVLERDSQELNANGSVGSGLYTHVDGWSCGRPTLGESTMPEYVGVIRFCNRESDGAEIVLRLPE